MIRRFENLRIGRFAIGVALICFFVMNSFSFVNLRPPYKTIKDSVFEVDDYIRIPTIAFQFLTHVGIWQDSIHHGMDSLKLVAEFLKRNPRLAVEIGNYSDVDYSKYSTHVTYGRARSCLDSLVKLGIDRDRLKAVGYGQSQPFITDQSLELPSGAKIDSGVVLTDKYFAAKYPDRKGADYQYLKMLNRQTILKVLRTDFIPTSGN